MPQTQSPIHKGDWIRFQALSDKRVHEGFVQDLADNGHKLRIGKAAYSLEATWFSLSEIRIIQQQRR